MAWTNASLTTAIERWTENLSTDFIDSIPDIIRLAEARIFRDTKLRDFNFTLATTLTSSANTFTFPTDMNSVRSIRLTDTNNREGILLQKHESFIDEYWPNVSELATPLYWAIVDRTQGKVAPTPDSGYTLSINYLALPTGLASATDGTWLSNNGEDVLFYACMVEALLLMKSYGGQRSDVDFWEERYIKALAAFKARHEGEMYNEQMKRDER